jgi:HK97 family phage prohead protease
VTGFLAANEQMGMEYRDVWTAAYINDLPDSAFLYIEPGGSKDADGRTMPRALRHFPVRDANGKPDAAHIRNALARIPQASSIPADARAACMAKAKKMAGAHPMIGSGPDAGYEGNAGSGRARQPAGIEFRSFTIELRSDGDGRILIGRAVPYGETTTLPNGSMERFAPGAFGRQVAQGEQWGQVKLYDSHSARLDGKNPVGRTVQLGERPDGLYGEWHLHNTTAGNDALELVRSGEVTGLSVGFRPQSSRRGPDGAIERRTAHLDHVVLTHEPAYATAGVTAVRSIPAGRPASEFRAFLLRAQGINARFRS